MKIVLLISSLLISLQVHAASLEIPGVQINLKAPAKFILSKGRMESTLYPATDCLDLSLSNQKGVGYICLSRSADAQKEFGVGEFSDGKSKPSFSVATGISVYPLEVRFTRPMKIYVAETDCDDGYSGSPVYRATATCLVAYAPLTCGSYLYGNFLLRNDVVRKNVMQRADVDAILKSIKLVRPSSAVKDRRNQLGQCQ